jgi:ferredoxin-NADP reductase
VTSPQRRRANRLNAQRSTGPKSPRGKRASSLNAMKHGLSLPVEQLVQQRFVSSLQSLIEQEGIEPAHASDLATKILDYERNVARELETFPPYEGPPLRTPEELMGLVREDWPEWDMVDDHVDYEFFTTGRLSRSTIRMNFSLKSRMIKMWWRKESRHIRNQRRRQEFTDRHLRRASNQLIKSLRQALG